MTGGNIPLWERERNWPLMRPFVYHLMENFVHQEWVTGRRVIDFSAGLGDLSRYLVARGATSVLATAPEDQLVRTAEIPGVTWRSDVHATRISERLDANSADLVCARMVLQFPRWEDGGADVDTMLNQFHKVLAPGGRIVIASHQFFPLQNYSSVETERDADALVTRLSEMATSAPRDIHEILTEDAERVAGLTELVRYLGIPPRESSVGTTGYGLRVPLLVDSFVRAGFQIELVDDIEPFTFPVGMWARFDTEADAVAAVGKQVYETKRRYLLDPVNTDPYARPGHHRRMLAELRELMTFVWVPIVRIVARIPD